MSDKSIKESEREVPVAKEVEVLVAGGGPAGVAAALAAARNGAEVLLVEQYGCVGGMGTVGLVGPFMRTAGADSGIFKEVLERLSSLGGAQGMAFDPEVLKIVLIEMLEEAKVQLLLHTFVEGTIVEDKTVKGIFVANKGGRAAILAQVVIDATGDGDVAYFAGAPYWKGREEDGQLQGVTLFFRVGGIDFGRVPKDLSFLTEKTKEAREAGEFNFPDYVLQAPMGGKWSTLREGEMSVNVDMITGIDGTDPWQLTLAELECHKRVWECINFYRKYIPGMENCSLIDTAALIGIRETRRIQGVDIVTGEDVISGRKRVDGIAIASFFIDLHDPEMFLSEEPWWKTRKPPEGDWYDIPYGCLVPKYHDGLLLAGRCISSDREANGSLRVMPTCMATGQAAGTAAALSVKVGVKPRELDVTLLRQTLLEQGVNLGENKKS